MSESNGPDFEEVTAENIEHFREHVLPRDQAAEIEIGCLVWNGSIEDRNNYGRVIEGCIITVWPRTDRFAFFTNSDSDWGDWLGSDTFWFEDAEVGDIVIKGEHGVWYKVERGDEDEE